MGGADLRGNTWENNSEWKQDDFASPCVYMQQMELIKFGADGMAYMLAKIKGGERKVNY